MSNPLEPAPPQSRLSGTASTFESVGKILATGGLGLYAFGLLVANEYLVELRLSDWQLLKAQSFLTGFWTTLLVAVSLIPAALLWFGAQKGDGFLRRIAVTIITLSAGWLFMTMFSALVLGLVDAQDVSDMPALSNWHFFHPREPIWEMALTSFVMLFLVRMGVTSRAGTRAVSDKRVFGIAALLTLIASSWIVSKEIYGRVPRAYGGGLAESVILVLNKEGALAWSTLCGVSDGGGTSRRQFNRPDRGD